MIALLEAGVSRTRVGRWPRWRMRPGIERPILVGCRRRDMSRTQIVDIELAVVAAQQELGWVVAPLTQNDKIRGHGIAHLAVTV